MEPEYLFFKIVLDFTSALHIDIQKIIIRAIRTQTTPPSPHSYPNPHCTLTSKGDVREDSQMSTLQNKLEYLGSLITIKNRNTLF